MRYLHCRTCAATHSKPSWLLEVSVDSEGLHIDCPDHGVVALIQPEPLKKLMETEPPCEHCQKGVPHEHTH